MPRLFAAYEVAVGPHVLPDVLVADGGLLVAYAHGVERLVQAEVRHDGRDERIGVEPAAVLHVLCAHVHDLVAGDVFAVLVHGEASVRVAVEGEAYVQPLLFHELLKRPDMRRAAVHVDIYTVRPVADDVGIRPECVEHALGYHPGAAVGAVEPDLHVLVRVRREADEVADIPVPSRGVIHRPAYVRTGGVGRLGQLAVEVFLYLVEDILLHLLALGIQQLDAVINIGVVARAYHHAAVEVVHTRDIRHARSRRDVQQVGVRARGREPRRKRALEHVARAPRVLAYDYLGLVLPAVVPAYEAAYLECVFRGEVHVGLAPEAVCSEILAHCFLHMMSRGSISYPAALICRYL